jgi:hypothetical protein
MSDNNDRNFQWLGDNIKAWVNGVQFEQEAEHRFDRGDGCGDQGGCNACLYRS